MTTDLSCEFSGSSRRVELALTSQPSIRIIVVAAFPASYIEAKGKVDDKVVRVPDTFLQSCVGLGAGLRVHPDYQRSEVLPKRVLSDRLSHEEGKVGLNMLYHFLVDAGRPYHRTKLYNGVWTDQVRSYRVDCPFDRRRSPGFAHGGAGQRTSNAMELIGANPTQNQCGAFPPASLFLHTKDLQRKTMEVGTRLRFISKGPGDPSIRKAVPITSVSFRHSGLLTMGSITCGHSSKHLNCSTRLFLVL